MTRANSHVTLPIENYHLRSLSAAKIWVVQKMENCVHPDKLMNCQSYTSSFLPFLHVQII